MKNNEKEKRNREKGGKQGANEEKQVKEQGQERKNEEKKKRNRSKGRQRRRM